MINEIIVEASASKPASPTAEEVHDHEDDPEDDRRLDDSRRRGREAVEDRSREDDADDDADQRRRDPDSPAGEHDRSLLRSIDDRVAAEQDRLSRIMADPHYAT